MSLETVSLILKTISLIWCCGTNFQRAMAGRSKRMLYVVCSLGVINGGHPQSQELGASHLDLRRSQYRSRNELVLYYKSSASKVIGKANVRANRFSRKLRSGIWLDHDATKLNI